MEKSAHGAHPDQGVDGYLCSCRDHNRVQVMIAWEVSPLDSAVCTFGSIKAGTARNQIADRLKWKGIIWDTGSFVQMRMRRESVRAAADCSENGC